MNKTLVMWVVGSVITISAIGLGFNATVNAAEKEAGKPAMQQGMMMPGDKQMGSMDDGSMADKMKSGDMQKNCMEMMKSPEMQANMKEMMKDMMKDMMKNPEMQGQMKEMMKDIVQENK